MSLGATLDAAVAAAVRAAVEAERPLIIAAVRAELASEARAPLWLRPSEVRVLARCSSAAVFAAIRSGALAAEEEHGPARPGIPSRRWKIRRDNAVRWASARGKVPHNLQ